MGLEIIAQVLSPFCNKIDVIDLRHEAYQAAVFVKMETDLICISINWDRNIDTVQKQIRSLSPHIFTVVGGRHVTEAPEKWLLECPNIDVVVRGDGEETIEEIAQRRPLADIVGISYRRDGGIVHNPNRECQPVRDDLYPDRRRRRYRYAIDFEGIDTGIIIDSVAGSRGCPYNCKFCSFSINPWGEKQSYTARSAESVVDELAEIEADWVLFTDDVFTHDTNRVEEICDLIIQRGIKKHYVVNSRIEISKYMGTVRKMEQAGFAALFLGVESTQDRTLRAMNKGFDTAGLRECFHTLRHTTMLLHGYFILGCIGETEDEMLQIAPFARSLGIDTLGLSPLRHLPHDGLEKLVSDTPGYHISSNGYVFSDQIQRDELKEIRRRVWRRFYTPGHLLGLLWKLLRGGILTPATCGRLLLAAIRGGWAKRRRKRRN